MYQKVFTKCKVRAGIFIGLFCSIYLPETAAQLAINAQLRARSEWRNGFGTLQPLTGSDAFFVSQRTRLNLNYRHSQYIFHFNLQDVRIWGQDASTISSTDGARLGVHEAWAELILSNKKDSTFKKKFVDLLSLRIGRQELVYDDQRLLGNLDWLQQGRRHDAVIIKLTEGKWHAEVGTAFNQNTDAFNYNGTYYTPANIPATIKDSKGNMTNSPAGMIPLINASGNSSKNGNPAFVNPPGTNGATQNYKTFQFLHFTRNISSAKISGLLFLDQFGKYQLDSVINTAGNEGGYVYGKRYNQKGVNSRITTGLYTTIPFGNLKTWNLSASYYYQGEKDRDNHKLSAYTSAISLVYQAKKLNYTIGWDILSGNDAFSGSEVNHRFDPLYGTPHKFWGAMDYFYAGTGSPSGGLSNPFLKMKYLSGNKSFSTELNYHYFALSNQQKDISGKKIDKYLGSEFDLITSYQFNKFSAIECGISYMAASNSMDYAKNITPESAYRNPTWSYLQLNIKPEFIFK